MTALGSSAPENILAWCASNFTQVLGPVTLLGKESQPSQDSAVSDKRGLGWTNPAVV